MVASVATLTKGVPQMKSIVLATAVAFALPATANAATLIVDVSGSQSFYDFLTPGNTVNTYDIGANSHVTGLTYDVNITAFSPSYLSEARIAYTDSGVTAGVTTAPGFGNDFSGTQSFVGSADLIALGLDFNVGADGILRLEYFEDFDDGSVSPDAIWNSGTLTFTYDTVGGGVPEPAAWALLMLGFGAIGGAMRGRRRQEVTTAYA